MTDSAVTVLCIDDDQVFLDLYTTILEPEGYRVLVAYEGAEGLAMAIREKPALITLDVMLPEKMGFMDGYGLLQEFRQVEVLASTPVVMMSALGGDEDAKHGIELGADEFIPKQDLTPELLVAVVKKLLKNTDE